MGVLLVTCPATGKEFSTGVQIDEQSMIGLPNVAAQARCPFCKVDHSWRKSEARFVDSIPPALWVENQE